MVFILATLIGVVAGLRAMMAPAAISWAAHLGWLRLGDTPLALLGYSWTPWILTLLALGELVTDQLPSTPSRTVPVQFGGRVVMGALSGAAIGSPSGSPTGGAMAGAVGAVIGTLGGQAARANLASAFGKDQPAAFLEDAVAILAALAIVMVLP
ncbi:DUF4126 family protein [Microvirga sp. BT350]|uniref:DUF4126 family protein n=1 Tax=Microvirga alba TaxID=2791025 RepID=A0A931FNN7_9HYPH|nr:DUF4126 family protein [Microvirga alba]MBF9233870.1 DUF4126 family protein [Microvirga alba]